jgi:hypothetical protein
MGTGHIQRPAGDELVPGSDLLDQEVVADVVPAVVLEVEDSDAPGVEPGSISLSE